MLGMKWECACGCSIEVTGRDESSRNAVAAYKHEHAGHERMSSLPEEE